MLDIYHSETARTKYNIIYITDILILISHIRFLTNSMINALKRVINWTDPLKCLAIGARHIIFGLPLRYQFFHNRYGRK
jgi:hypothetical protein